MSYSFKVFFWLHRRRRFDIIRDTEYSRYTRETVALENPNFITASGNLYLVSRIIIIVSPFRLVS